jgi:hypothetical protein
MGYFMVADHRTWTCIPVFWDTMVQHRTFFIQASDQEGNVRMQFPDIIVVVLHLGIDYQKEYFAFCHVVVDINTKDRLVHETAGVCLIWLPNAGDGLILQRTHACSSGQT